MAGEQAVAGLGSIASSFAQGYQQARGIKRQQEHQDREEQYGHVDRLFKMADMVQDPKMKETLFNSATSLMDQLDSPKPANKKPGIGGTIAQLFGFGNKKPAAGMGPTNRTFDPAQLDQPSALPAVPDPVSPDSQTYGNLSQYFGQELNQQPTSVTTGTPPMPQAKSALELSKQPTQAMATQPQPVARPAAVPQVPGTPQSGLGIPSATDITAEAMKATQSPSGMFRGEGYKEQLYARQRADSIAKALLGATDQHLAEHPEIKTLGQAYNDPQLGPEFREVMATIGDYESAGHLSKGYLENWQKRFDDVRFGSDKYNPQATANGYQINPATQRYDIPIGDKKLEDQTGAIFKKDPSTWTPEDQAAVSGWQAQLEAKERANHPLSDEDRLKKDYIDELRQGITDGHAGKAMKQYQSVVHPVQPPSMVFPPGASTIQNGQKFFTGINPKNGATLTTGIAVPANFDLDKVMRMEKNVQVPSKTFPGRTEPTDMKVFDPTQVKRAFQSGELSGSDPNGAIKALQDIVNSGAFANDNDKRDLELFLKSVLNPNPYNK